MAIETSEAFEEESQPVAHNRRPWSIRVQLLLAVNVPLAIGMVALLALDYHREVSEAMRKKHISLKEEASAIHQAVLHLSGQHGADSIQQHIDTVCGRMRYSHSPGHHIAVRWNGQDFQAQSHHRASSEILAAMRQAARSGNHQAQAGGKSLIVGSFSQDGVDLYVSESTENILRSIRAEILWHLSSLLVLGSSAVVIVHVVLWKLVAQPLAHLVATANRIEGGELGAQADAFSSQELGELSVAVNAMSDALAEGERRKRFEMEKAKQIQNHLLPDPMDIPGLNLAFLYLPAEHVAGDFYDVVKLADGSYLLAVADVTGHGVPAAMGAAILKVLLHHAVERRKKPGEILQLINRQIPDSFLPGDFASMFIACWHPDSALLEYASAGHEPAMLLSRDGELRELLATGWLLGIKPEGQWDTEQAHLEADDCLLVVTDGVVETTDIHDELFGRGHLAKLFAECADRSPEEISRRLEEVLSCHRKDAPATDDVTIVVAKFQSRPESDD